MTRLYPSPRRHGHMVQLFYARLFELGPGLEGLFHGGMNQQGQKLMAAIAFVVEGLDNRLRPIVRDHD